MTNTREKTYFLIINPFAGGRSTTKKIKELISIFQKKKCNYQHAFTQKPGHATKLAKEAIHKKFDVVVAVGGDGTINEVVRGIIGTSAMLGIVPLGSGNGLARELGISMNIQETASILFSNVYRPIDTWEIGDQLFLCTCGIGFDAYIAQKMSFSNTRGAWQYIKLVIKECICYEPISLKLLINGKQINTNVFLATFANTSQFGNNAYISPGAKVDDELIDIILMKPFLKLVMPIVGISLLTKTILLFPFVKRYRTSEVTIENSTSNTFHYDGETCTLNFPIKIQRHTHKLNIISN